MMIDCSLQASRKPFSIIFRRVQRLFSAFEGLELQRVEKDKKQNYEIINKVLSSYFAYLPDFAKKLNFFLMLAGFGIKSAASYTNMESKKETCFL